MSTRRGAFASQMNYGALAVDSGESEEEEVLDTPVDEAPTPSDGPEPKMTKTAARKAAKAARDAKKSAKASAKVSPALTPAPAPAPALPQVSSTESLPELEPAPAPAPLQEPTKPALSTAAASASPATQPQQPLQAQVEAVQRVVAKATEPVQVAAGQASAAILNAVEPVQAAVAKVAEPVKAKVVEPVQVAAAKIAEPVQAAFTKGVEAALPPADDAEKQKKRANVLERTTWTFIMIGGFLGLLLMGHAYMIALVLFCQTLVYREVTALFSLKGQDTRTEPSLPGGRTSQGRDPWSKTLNWYFFGVTNYFLYGESIIYYFKHVVFVDAHLTALANQHRFISFMLYTIGFVGFVASLKRGYLAQQFGLFCWVHMTLLLIVLSSHFIVNNILEGLIWFWVPASLVICNDIFAYICGVTMGRTPLIALSPKKTVEGFVGALFCTVAFGLWFGTYFARFDYMVCPVQDLGVGAFGGMRCARNPVFVWRDGQLPEGLAAFLSTLLGRTVTTMPYMTYQVHLFFLSCFASLVAPFGGFFASGFKRAFNVKDFGDSIPGHGGMTDRMDCQFLMGVFTYVYYTSLIRTSGVSVGGVLQTIVSGLSTEEQLALIADLRRYLEGQGIVVPA